MAETALKQSYIKRGCNAHRRDAIIKFAGEKVLDVGCGSGAYVLELMDRFDIHGLDYQEFPSWEEAPERFGLSDAATLPCDDESYDTIATFETLEHLPDPLKALKEYYRVCKKNLILTVPNCEGTEAMKKSNLIYGHYIDPTHCNFFTMKSLTNLITETGFRIQESYYINKINPLPFVFEFFKVPEKHHPKLHKLINKFLKTRDHYITSLVVAEK